ncbi:hypothetical protein BBF96_11470 [Anoxybacter fermentans]|uniref:Uncharacterized protein n=1 Tax=Anoxybacter fermentans TaxID=1323375 RepID=A0A3Q9HRE2_9FIRM|nr:hypothetical protein [Anoxybacter fermentans]AZR73955.1 hypothetical protein BBF96_11470 [Anoxybacter fermentans]
MNKIAFIFANILFFFGLTIIVLINFTQRILPKIGYMVFLMTKSGSYTAEEYVVSFPVLNLIAVVCIVLGLMVSIICYLKATK